METHNFSSITYHVSCEKLCVPRHYSYNLGPQLIFLSRKLNAMACHAHNAHTSKIHANWVFCPIMMTNHFGKCFECDSDTY